MRTGLIWGLVLFAQMVWGAADYGVFMVVKGKVKIQNSTASVDAKVGSKVYEGDTVATESDSRAKIVMSDRNIINVSPNTKLKIEKYSSNPKDKNVKLNLIEGKVRNNVEQKYNNQNSKFEVRTATAVAGVRGTQFITTYNPTTRVTEVVTLKGQVSFQSLSTPDGSGSSGAAEPVVVNKGEKSETQSGGGASAPVKVPEQEIRQIDSDTSVKKDRADSTAGGTAAAPPPAETRPAAQPAAGTPLVDMNNPRNPVIDGAASRKFDKSKVRIRPTPGN